MPSKEETPNPPNVPPTSDTRYVAGHGRGPIRRLASGPRLCAAQLVGVGLGSSTARRSGRGLTTTRFGTNGVVPHRREGLHPK